MKEVGHWGRDGSLGILSLVCLSIYHLSIYLSIYQSIIYLPIYHLSTNLSSIYYLSIYLSIYYLSIYQSIIYLSSINLSSINLSIYLSTSVSLFIYGPHTHQEVKNPSSTHSCCYDVLHKHVKSSNHGLHPLKP
jgi:hypothetical protein